MNSSLRSPLKSQDPNIPIEDMPVIVQQKLSTITKENNEVKKDSDRADHLNVLYFRKTLKEARRQLNNFCDFWSEIQSNLENFDDIDVIKGDIRSAIGQANLVMDQRFSQFEELVNNCEYGTSEKPVTCADLQGFWDMIYVQVQDVIDKFDNLEKQRKNNWKTDAPVVFKPKKVIKKCKTRTSAEIAAGTARREAARKRLAAAKAALKKEQHSSITFDAGFFQVNSPARKKSNEKPKTPSSIARRKKVTPKSENFMHGRIVKRITRSSKKILNFDPLLAKKIDEDNNAQIMQEIAETKTMNENKENVAPCLNTSPASQQPVTPAACKTVAVMTDVDPYNNTFEDAIEIIINQMKIISATQQELKPCYLQELQKKVHLLEAENDVLKCDISRLKENRNNSQCYDLKLDENDDPYQLRYKRLLEDCKLFQSELSAYHQVKDKLSTSAEKWKKTFDLFRTKKEELVNWQHCLNTQKRILEEKTKQENEELRRLGESNTKLLEEVNLLRHKCTAHESLIKDHQTLNDEHKQLQEDIAKLKEARKQMIKEKNDLNERLGLQCDHLETLQKEIQTINENHLFEKEEFANDKAFFEEEKNLLQSQLFRTEETLKSTLDALQIAKDKANHAQAQVEDQRVQIEKYREDMIVLREETDITKVNSRLVILEQQQEVIDCETKLRKLLDQMASFLLTLKNLSGTSSAGESMPLLSDHPMKTPSKSLVVSAILRRENQQNERELSPEDKFDRKSQACLFALINDVSALMESITKTAASVAARYELEKKELAADKSILQSRIDSFKSELTNQSQSEKDVEIFLRRRLREVMTERDDLRLKLTSNK